MKTILALLLVPIFCLAAASVSFSEPAAKDEIILKDFDETSEVFSFQEGKLIKLSPKDEKKMSKQKPKFDIMLDLPHGLGTNNRGLSPVNFNGSAGIIDMGEKSINSVDEAPQEGYKPALSPSEIREGHTYCIKTADGQHYAKMEILKFNNNEKVNPKESFIKFIWKYQPKKNIRTFN